jgi:hypothetical protein
MGTQITAGTYSAGSGIAAEHLFTFDGYNDAGFTWLMMALRSGNPGEINSAITLWDLAANDLVSLINGLYQAYSRISQTWSGTAADAFYTEMARVQTFAGSCLMSLAGKHAPTSMTMIPATVAGPGGMPATPAALPAVTTTFSGAAILERVAGSAGVTLSTPTDGTGLVGNSLVDVLNDCVDVLTTAGKLADKVLSQDAGAAWTLATWVWNKYWQEDAGTKIQFALDVIGGQVLTMPGLTVWQPVVAMVDLLSGNVQGAMQLMFTPTTGKVFMQALADQAHQPATFVSDLASAWSANAQALPNALDPSQNTGQNGNGNQPTMPSGPSMPTTSPYPTSQPKMPTAVPAKSGTGAGGPAAGTGVKSPALGSAGNVPTGVGTPSGYTPAGYSPVPYSGTGVNPDASLASFNPNGLGAAGGLGAGAGDLAGAGLGAGTGAGAGDLAGAGAGLGAGAAAGAAGRGMPMTPPGGQGAGKDDKARNRTAYMSEDEEVWGVGGDVSDGVL